MVDDVMNLMRWSFFFIIGLMWITLMLTGAATIVHWFRTRGNQPCPLCDAKGRLYTSLEDGDGKIMAGARVQVVCPLCRGEGYTTP